MTGRRGILLEVFGTTAAVLVLIRVWLALIGSGIDAFGGIAAIVIPVLFMWGPVVVLQRRGIDPDQYPLAVPGTDEGALWRRSFWLFLLSVLVITPPFLAVYAWWYEQLFPAVTQALCDQSTSRRDMWRAVCPLARQVADLHFEWRWPDDPLRLVAYHLLFVAPGEELFYRGYVQSRLDEVWAPRWRILGATLGPGWIVTCAVFAFGHSVVSFQWWHFAIFFPSLVFGWLRARTGHVVAGALFHAWCNVLVGFLDVMWGLAPPSA